MPPIKEREEARLERQLEKQKKRKTVIWIIIAITVVVLIVLRVFEINVNSVKNKIVDDNGKISIGSSETVEFPYYLDSSRVKVNAIDDKLCLLTESSLTMLNVSNAKPDYVLTHGYGNPIANISGKYVCLIDQGSNRFRLDDTKENVYEMKTESPISCAGVSKNGRVAYAVKGDSSKSVVYVISKGQLEKMKLEVNSGYVVSLALDASGKKLAVASINSKDAKLVTAIDIYNVGNESSIASFTFENTHLMDLHYSKSGELYVVTTDGVQMISGSKKQKSVFELGAINTNCFSYTDKDELVIAYSDYAGSTKDFVAYVNSSGKVKTSVELDSNAKYISSAGSNVTVLLDNKIVTYSLRSGKEKNTVECESNLTSANRLSSKIFVTHQQLVDAMG